VKRSHNPQAETTKKTKSEYRLDTLRIKRTHNSQQLRNSHMILSHQTNHKRLIFKKSKHNKTKTKNKKDSYQDQTIMRK
jgi:hypothetical protein